MPVEVRKPLRYDELWPQEQELCARAVEGGLLDLRCGRPDEDDPARGRGWRHQRRVQVQVLFQLLTGHGPQLAGRVLAVRLRAAQIVGRLDHGLDLSSGFRCGRGVDLGGAQIGGWPAFDGSVVSNPGGVATFGFTFVGWLLAAIVVAGLGGVFKRD